jgi:molybdopterin synthase sulfur carrier subunit
MPLVNIKYFALLREKANIESEEVSFEGTYEELYKSLNEKYNFDLTPEMIMVAVNDEFTHMSGNVTPNAKVVFIPPVAGG